MVLHQNLSFKPIDLEQSQDICIRFQADAWFCSTGSDEAFYATVDQYIVSLHKRIAALPDSCVHVWHDDQIIGQIEMSLMKQASSIGYVNLFYLVPAYRHQGLGRLLDNYAVDYLQRLGCQTARLTVSPSNQPAIKFYEKCGWVDIGARPDQPLFRYMEKILERE